MISKVKLAIRDQQEIASVWLSHGFIQKCISASENECDNETCEYALTSLCNLLWNPILCKAAVKTGRLLPLASKACFNQEPRVALAAASVLASIVQHADSEWSPSMIFGLTNALKQRKQLATEGELWNNIAIAFRKLSGDVECCRYIIQSAAIPELCALGAEVIKLERKRTNDGDGDGDDDDNDADECEGFLAARSNAMACLQNLSIDPIIAKILIAWGIVPVIGVVLCSNDFSSNRRRNWVAHTCNVLGNLSYFSQDCRAALQLPEGTLNSLLLLCVHDDSLVAISAASCLLDLLMFDETIDVICFQNLEPLFINTAINMLCCELANKFPLREIGAAMLSHYACHLRADSELLQLVTPKICSVFCEFAARLNDNTSAHEHEAMLLYCVEALAIAAALDQGIARQVSSLEIVNTVFVPLGAGFRTVPRAKDAWLACHMIGIEWSAKVIPKTVTAQNLFRWCRRQDLEVREAALWLCSKLLILNPRDVASLFVEDITFHDFLFAQLEHEVPGLRRAGAAMIVSLVHNDQFRTSMNSSEMDHLLQFFTSWTMPDPKERLEDELLIALLFLTCVAADSSRWEALKRARGLEKLVSVIAREPPKSVARALAWTALCSMRTDQHLERKITNMVFDVIGNGLEEQVYSSPEVLLEQHVKALHFLSMQANRRCHARLRWLQHENFFLKMEKRRISHGSQDGTVGCCSNDRKLCGKDKVRREQEEQLGILESMSATDERFQTQEEFDRKYGSETPRESRQQRSAVKAPLEEMKRKDPLFAETGSEQLFQSTKMASVCDELVSLNGIESIFQVCSTTAYANLLCNLVRVMENLLLNDFHREIMRFYGCHKLILGLINCGSEAVTVADGKKLDPSLLNAGDKETLQCAAIQAAVSFVKHDKIVKDYFFSEVQLIETLMDRVLNDEAQMVRDAATESLRELCYHEEARSHFEQVGGVRLMLMLLLSSASSSGSSPAEGSPKAIQFQVTKSPTIGGARRLGLLLPWRHLAASNSQIASALGTLARYSVDEQGRGILRSLDAHVVFLDFLYRTDVEPVIYRHALTGLCGFCCFCDDEDGVLWKMSSERILQLLLMNNSDVVQAALAALTSAGTTKKRFTELLSSLFDRGLLFSVIRHAEKHCAETVRERAVAFLSQVADESDQEAEILYRAGVIRVLNDCLATEMHDPLKIRAAWALSVLAKSEENDHIRQDIWDFAGENLMKCFKDTEPYGRVDKGFIRKRDIERFCAAAAALSNVAKSVYARGCMIHQNAVDYALKLSKCEEAIARYFGASLLARLVCHDFARKIIVDKQELAIISALMDDQEDPLTSQLGFLALRNMTSTKKPMSLKSPRLFPS